MRREIVLFGLIGAIAFAVDVGVLYLLKSSLGVYWGRAVSFVCAVFVTWLLNRNITFKVRSSGLSLFTEFARYFFVMLGGGSVNYLVYAVLVTVSVSVAAQPVWGVAAGSCAGLLFNFTLARCFVFKISSSDE
jgi:putative flippase GtrA